MINVQPFLDRLEELKNHMDFYIEMLHTSQYFKCHIIEERPDIKYVNPHKFGAAFFDKNGMIQEIAMFDDGSIKAHMDLMDHLKADLDNWINGISAYPKIKLVTPNLELIWK